MINRVQERNNSSRGSLLYFTAVCVTAALGGFLFGFDTAVISGALGFLESQFSLGPMMLGWVVSAALVGCLIGAGGAGALSDYFGRKRILILSGLLFMLTSLGCALAPGPHTLAISRLIGGLGVGMACTIVPLYIAEISPRHLRGRMVALNQFAVTLGILAAYLSNAGLIEISENVLRPRLLDGTWRWLFVDEVWRGMLGSLLLPSSVFFVGVFFIPESPRWLAKQGRSDAAAAVLARVVGDREAEREMADIVGAVSEEKDDVSELLKPAVLVALAMAVLVAAGSQFTGINAIIYYGPKIFENAGFQIGKALGGQAILGSVNVLFTILALWKIDTLGRKPLLLVGTLGVFFSLIMVGVFFALGMTEGVWLVLFMSSYLAFFAFSFGPMATVFASEVFPTRIRGRAMSVVMLLLWSANTIVCQTFPLMDKHLGPAWTFWIYAAMVVPVILFAWKVMPETKGRSLEELERYFLEKVKKK